MITTGARNYNCKDEELPIIGNKVLFSFKRDEADFISYSPKFDNGYATALEGKIQTVFDLVEPKSETVELKNITDGIYTAMDELIDPINRVTGYITLGKLDKIISLADWGLTQLRKNIKSRDGEGVIKNLHTVNLNLVKFKTELEAQGLNAELAAKFSTAYTTIVDGKQKQYEIVSNRKLMVQNNLSVCNDLFEQLTEIMTIGKILYKATDAVKLQEYTFSELIKTVRKTSSTANVAAAQVKTDTTAS
jgi:roadblock/LC7 domain-containing protein